MKFDASHDLCFAFHDAMAQSLVSGEECGIFSTRIELPIDIARALEGDTEAFLKWLESEKRFEERAAVVLSTVFPAALSDMLHCLYEALESSRKAKLNITYMLLRKPIQETLFLFESIILSKIDFTAKLATNPLQLRGANAGGPEAHTRRIEKVLAQIGEGERFDAAYIAQLRYVKCEDGFDGLCNHAMHLFTEHHAIATGPMNINFIFSGWQEKLSQWAFLYSRLPYLLSYIHCIVEHITKDFALTHPTYHDDIERRLAALTVLSWTETDARFECKHQAEYLEATYRWLRNHCSANHRRDPSASDLMRMAKNGALPGESWFLVQLRSWRFSYHAWKNRNAAKQADDDLDKEETQ